MSANVSTSAQDARTGVDRRGRQLAAGLAALAVLSAVGGVGLLAGGAALWSFARSQLEGSGLFPLPGGLPAWTVPTLVLLVLLGVGIVVWAILRARSAILAVRAQTLRPGAERAAWLEREVRAVRPWITLGQWTPPVGLLLELGFLLVTLRWVGGLDLPDAPEFAVAPLEFVLVALSLLGQSLPGLVINGLILAAVRRWLDGVLARARGRSAPLLPAARALDGWFLFVAVLLGLGVLSLLVGLALVAALPALIRALESGAALGGELAWLPALRAGLLSTLLFALLNEGLLLILLLWSRRFALDVARVLDVDEDDSSAWRPEEAWKGQETLVPPRVDLRS